MLCICAAVVLVAAGPASAGFSAPVFVGALEGTGEHDPGPSLAVNDRGEALAAYQSENTVWCSNEPRPGPGSVVFQAIGPTGLVGTPEPVQVPGWFGGGLGSVSLDDEGRAAVGVRFSDWTAPTGCEEHSAGWGARAAVATWQLDHGQPRLALLLPKRARGEALGAPAVALDRRQVSAVWPVGFEDGGVSEPEPTFIEQAHGPFGGALRGAVLASAGPDVRTWSLLDVGGPFAVWINRTGRTGATVHTATGRPGGWLTRAHRGVGVPGEAAEVVRDPGGDVVVGMTVLREEHERLHQSYLMLSSTHRGRFRRRSIALIGDASSASIAAGGHGGLLLIESQYNSRAIFARRGSIDGHFGPAIELGRTPEFSEPEAFIDRSGRAVVVFTRQAKGRGAPTEVVAATALPGHPFSKPRQLAPSLRGCQVTTPAGSTPDEAGVPKATTSDDQRHAVILVSCGPGRLYTIFYSS